MPCRSPKDVQTAEGPAGNEAVNSNGDIGSVASTKNAEVKEMPKDKINHRGGDKENNNNDSHQNKNGDLMSEDAPRKKVCLCCTAADVQTEDSLTPIDKGKEGVVDNHIDETDKKSGVVSDDDDDDVSDMEQAEDVPGKRKLSQSRRRNRKPLRTITKNPKYYVDDEGLGKATVNLSSKKGKYTLPEHGDDTDDTDKMSGRPMPARRPPPGKKTVDLRASSEENDEAETTKRSPKKKKGKKKKEIDTDEAMEMRSIYENQIASLQESPTHTQMPQAVSNVDLVVTGPPTVEMEEDLLENAEEERRKNKQRLREKRRKEKESPIKTPHDNVDAVYETAQKEIDRVLGPRKDNIAVEKPRKKSSSKDKKKKKEKSEDSGDSQPEECPATDTLDEARVKIHRLLDDAFSLISQSRSSMGNKVHPTSQQSSIDKGSPRSQQSHRSHSSIEQADQDVEEPAVKEKKHTPIHVERSHGAYDRSGLISWSPYRASDDTALISLPNTQTNLNSVAPQREPIKGTTVFSESLPNSLQPNYYTTLPGEPIVLNTKEFDSNHPHPHASNHHHHHHYPNGDSINVKSNNPNPESKHRNSNSSSHGRGGDEFYTPYYGMSSYHELPPSSVVPNSPSSLTDDGKHNSVNVNNGKDYYYSNSDYRNKLNDHSSSSSGSIVINPHTAPGKGVGGENGGSGGSDFVDVIKHSVQPGASPQPLIHSLREELLNLSRKKGLSSSSSDSHNHHYNHNRSGGGGGGGENGIEKLSSKLDGKPPSGSLGQDVYHRNNRNKHMKTDL